MKKIKILITLIVIACIAAPTSMYAFASKNLKSANEIIKQVENELTTAQYSNDELYNNIDKLSNDLENAQKIINDLQLEIRAYQESEVIEKENEEEIKTYTDEDLMLLAKVIYSENGCSWFPRVIQLITGSVVLNRVNDEDFPNTIYDVVYQPGQYGCAWNGSFNIDPSEEAIESARFLLENGSIIPKNVVYQAGFTQGTGIYFTFYDPVLDVMQYFCYK